MENYMKREYEKKGILDTLNTVSSATDGAKIKIEFGPEETKISGSGLNLKICSTISSLDMALDENESAIFDVSFLIQAIRNLNGNIIRFEHEKGDSFFTVSGDHGQYKVNLFSEKVFNEIKFNTDCTAEFKIEKNVLSECISTTISCVEKNAITSRPILKGINIAVADGKITFQATDSYRLARKAVNLPFDGENFSVTVPAEAFKIISNMEDETITVRLFHNKVQFVGNNTIIQSNLLDGNYPDIDRLIPAADAFTGTLTCDKSALISALNSSNIIKNDNLSVVKLDMAPGKAVISSFNQEFGEYSEELNATYTGKPLCVSFSGSYLIDAVKTCNNDKITISFVGQMRPFIIEDGTEDELHLCLPVRTFS